MRMRTKTLIVAAGLTLLTIALIAPQSSAWIAIRQFLSVSGHGRSAQDANKYQWPALRLPEAASDVSYYIDHAWSEAEFAISENEFLQWCQASGWKTEKITRPGPYFKPQMMRDDLRPVSRGCVFYPPDGFGVFDAERSRANFRVSTFP
jgi:hypothetical protein